MTMHAETPPAAQAPAENRLICVILPAYNVAEFVAVAVASVAAQSWPNIHLIAVDDGSTDETGEILLRLAADWTRPGRRMEVIRQANRGASSARNAGLVRAHDDGAAAFVALLDADDTLYAECLTRLVATLDGAPDLDMTFPRLRYVDADGAPIGMESPVATARLRGVDLLGDNPIDSATGALIRADAVARAGMFDEGLSACIDLDYWVRVGAMRPRNIGPTDAILADYRRRAGQITSDWRRMERGWSTICEKLSDGGGGLAPASYNAARGRQCLYWSTIAYNAGDYSAARRLIREAWQRQPGVVARTPLGRIRTAACLASLLPSRAHDWIRVRFNARSGMT